LREPRGELVLRLKDLTRVLQLRSDPSDSLCRLIPGRLRALPGLLDLTADSALHLLSSLVGFFREATARAITAGAALAIACPS